MFPYVVKVVRVWVIILHGVMGSCVMCMRMPRGVVSSRSVQQCQSIGQFVMEVMAGLGHHGSAVPTARVYAAIHMTGAGQGGIFQNMAVHLSRLVQVTWRVVFCEEYFGVEGIIKKI